MDQRSALRADFDAGAREYDALRPKLIPCFDDFYGSALQQIPFGPDDAFDVLDLGAGTGLLAGLIAQRFPKARLTLIDLAEEMLDRARERFEGRTDVRIIAADYSATELPGQFHVIASALSIHHLEHDEKRVLFRRILHSLTPGGVFVNADDVLAPSQRLHAEYMAEWERQVRLNGVTDEQLTAAQDRQKHDRLAPLLDQLRWLNDAGFADVDCYYKYLTFSVFGGRRPPAG